MEVVEQDPELDHLILRSEATQVCLCLLDSSDPSSNDPTAQIKEDISSECQTPPLFGQVINLEESPVENVPQVETTQDDVSFSECKTPPFLSPIKHDIQPETESTRTILNFRRFDTNSTKASLNILLCHIRSSQGFQYNLLDHLEYPASAAMLPFVPPTCQGSPMRAVRSRDTKSIIPFFKRFREEV
ncbi:hypothetical protein Y032_0447g1624 [Ancylostoma ceylanicum]|uniref:Uncharacterized protein n=1 Tax=Ancylostoma ceylanicum TaxID=53326 RepID=A0A016WZ43_9BILA|nr:hypothetical protein Y032_0447g1624 [Ancylostoma ceylanicum]